MARRLRDLFALVHSSTQLINFGERDFRHGQPFAAFGVDEVHIPQLEAGNGLRTHILKILLEIVGAAGHIEERQPTQLPSRRGGIAGQCHFMDARTVRQLGKVQIFLDAGQDEIAGPVDRAVAAGAGVREGDDHIVMGRGPFVFHGAVFPHHLINLIPQVIGLFGKTLAHGHIGRRDRVARGRVLG